jgi:hypothetical protein
MINDRSLNDLAVIIYRLVFITFWQMDDPAGTDECAAKIFGTHKI